MPTERTALYRRWRPQTFGEIVGQQHVTRTLKNAIASSQVAHAYLLAGPRGTGKTSLARLIAKAVNCPNAKDGEPCDTCESCVAIREGRFLDLIEIDAASNRGIDEMRDLREKVRFAPSQGQYKVYVIDEAHQLTSEAFNALLKTLEEPPPHAIFVLATTESQKIPATIASRTQRFDLRRIPHLEIVRQLAHVASSEGLRAEPAALEAIARHAQGSLRDAESILDQLAAFSEDGSVTKADVADLLGTSGWEEVAELFDAFAAEDGAGAVALVGRLVEEGRDLHLFTRRALEHVRALVLVRYTSKAPDTLGEEASAKLRDQAPRFAPDRLAKIAKRLVEAEQQLRTGEGTPLPLELAVLELTAEGPPRPDAAQRSATEESEAAPRGHSPPAPESAPRVRSETLSGRRGPPGLRPAPRLAGALGADARIAPPSGGGAPAPTHEGPPRGAAGPIVEFGVVHEAWVDVIERTKERSIAKAAQLMTAEPLAVDGATVIVGFADDFAKGVWQDRQRPELERDLSTVLGLEVRVRCVRRPAAGVAPATEDPMLRAALETFRRPDRILEVE